MPTSASTTSAHEILLLPAHCATDDEPDLASETASPRPSPRNMGLRILLVEDHADSADALRRLLSLDGHRVAIASTVAAAKALADQPWDVVISDVGLPDGTGYDVGRYVRSRPWAPRLMVALTGYGSPEDMRDSSAAGFDAHLVKPFGVTGVLDMLHELT